MSNSQNERIQRMLDDYVLRDCRLADHPRIRARVLLVGEDRGAKVVAATGSEQDTRVGDLGRLPDDAVEWRVITKAAYWLSGSAHRLVTREPQTRVSSVMCIPVKCADGVDGVVSLDSDVEGFFGSADVGRSLLLAAILAYLGSQSSHLARGWTPASGALGTALARIRCEMRLTQQRLAAAMGQSRIALSQWERGRWPPGEAPLRRWCSALGLVQERPGPRVQVVDATPKMISLLKRDPSLIRGLSPAQFEGFVAERLERMGFQVGLTGTAHAKDGGIDIVATPRGLALGSYLLAVQVKHHRGDSKTGRQAVDRLLAWRDSDFSLGLLVTNTGFTRDARWVAEQVHNRSFLRLRDFEDVRRWMMDNFSAEAEWREIPEVITLAPGVEVAVPKPRLVNSLDIWPMEELRLQP